MQTRIFLDERRRRSSREIPVPTVPDGSVADDDLALRHTVLNALHGLDPLDRAIVVHRYLLDSDVTSVAEELRLTPQAVRSRAARALGKVRAALGTEIPGGAGPSGKGGN